jgi:putative membrane protein
MRTKRQLIFKRYVKEGDNADLNAWVTKTCPALEQHLTMVQCMNK